LASVAVSPFDARVDGPRVREQMDQSQKELRAVAIEYSRSLPHRLVTSLIVVAGVATFIVAFVVLDGE
jgi:hypothetical protein